MKYIFTLAFLLIVQTIQAQNLSLDQLVSLQTKDLEYVNEFLVSRGWQFDSSQAETDDKMGRAVWAHGKSNFDPEIAEAWFDLVYSPGYESTIRYQTHNKTQYTVIKNRMAALGMKLLSSEIVEDGLLSVYLGNYFAIKITSSSSRDSAVATYIFTVIKKEIYLKSLD